MCPEHEQLFEEKKKVWALWMGTRDSTRASRKMLGELEERALDALARWKEHIDSCLECKRDPNYWKWLNHTP